MPCDIMQSTLGLGLHTFHDHVQVLMCDFIMDLKLEQKANIKLCQNHEIGNIDPWNALASLQQESNEPGKTFRVALALQVEQNINGRLREVCVTLHESNQQKCWRNWMNCASGSPAHHQGSCWYHQHVIWNNSSSNPHLKEWDFLVAFQVLQKCWEWCD